jgi:hypothetical protein
MRGAAQAKENQATINEDQASISKGGYKIYLQSCSVGTFP